MPNATKSGKVWPVEHALSKHAAEMMARRRIPRECMERALDQPQRVQNDSNDPNVVHHLRAFAEYGDRVLRVLYNRAVSPVKIVSVFWDRRMKGKL